MTDVVRSGIDVVKSDILYLSKTRSHIFKPENYQGPLDPVVEILSPATAERVRTLKLDLHAKHGVKEYWIVDPDSARSGSCCGEKVAST